MSMSTRFQHSETTLLPLPPPQAGRSFEEVAEEGLRVALRLLQDHDFMMNLSPLHVHHEAIPPSADQAVDVEKMAAKFNVPLMAASEGMQRINGGPEWRHYEIQDQVPVMFGYKKDITFQTAIRNTMTGMESLSDPGNSVMIHGRYDVSMTDSDLSTLTLVETTVTHCHVLLGWYIKSNLGSSHGNIHKTIKARFVEEMQNSLSQAGAARLAKDTGQS